MITLVRLLVVILIISAISNIEQIENQTPSHESDIVNPEPMDLEEAKIVPDSKEPSLEFIKLPKYRSLDSNSIYSDVLSHSKQKPYGDKHGRYTNVHETAHGIHSELRNEHQSLFDYPINAFYCLDGKAVILPEPKIKLRHVSKYIPEILRSYRHKTYLIEQLKYWDDQPTYLLDEWSCYLLGSECAVDDHSNNMPLEKTDAISGSLEFSIYSIALAISIKEHDANYWENTPQFKEFVKYNLVRSEKVFNTGCDIPAFQYKEQDRLREALLNHPDAEPIRTFLKTEFDGIFVD